MPQIPAVIPDELPLNCCQLGPLLVRLCRIGTNGITHSNKGFETRHKKKDLLCALCRSISANRVEIKIEREKDPAAQVPFLFRPCSRMTEWQLFPVVTAVSSPTMTTIQSDTQ